MLFQLCQYTNWLWTCSWISICGRMSIYKVSLIRNWLGFRYKRTFSLLLRRSIFTTDKLFKAVLVSPDVVESMKYFPSVHFCFVFCFIFFNPKGTRAGSWPLHTHGHHLGNWIRVTRWKPDIGLSGVTDECLFFTTFSIQTVFFHKYANELSSKPLQNSFLFMFFLICFSILRCLFFLHLSSQPLYF